MKKFFLLAVLGAAAWYYFVPMRQLDEEKIREFYDLQTRATLGRDPTTLCNQLSDDFRSSDSVSMGGRRRTEEANKEQACQAAKDMYKTIAQIGSRLGGIATIDYGHEIESISISADKKSATVKSHYTLDVAGQAMRFRGSSTDTLIRKNGVVLASHSESATRMLTPE